MRKFEMNMRENLLLMQVLRPYRVEMVRNQREIRKAEGIETDLFWAERNRVARALYRRLVEA